MYTTYTYLCVYVYIHPPPSFTGDRGLFTRLQSSRGCFSGSTVQPTCPLARLLFSFLYTFTYVSMYL